MADGTFGVTGEVPPLSEDMVEAVENHRFEPLAHLFWRNRQLDFRSPEALMRSLERRPRAPHLICPPYTDDGAALETLLRDPEVTARATHPDAVRLLWEVCQIPDFRKTHSGHHLRLLGRIYGHLASAQRLLPEDWVARQIARIDRVDGDIDTLTGRIADVRTWAYVAHRPDWLANADHWRERGRDIEDRLSDALHRSLTQRFVDRRTALLIRRMKAGAELTAAVAADGRVLVEGEEAGLLEGFRFEMDPRVAGADARHLLSAARRALQGEMAARLRRFEAEPDSAFALSDRGVITWRSAPVARLSAGSTVLSPEVLPLEFEFLEGSARERLRRRLAVWLEGHLSRRLAPLMALSRAREGEDAELSGPARGLLYQLVERLGVLPRAEVDALVESLTRGDRRQFRALGLRIGRASLYLPAALTRRRAALNALLWTLHEGASPPGEAPALDRRVHRGAKEGGALSGPAGYWEAMGYRYFQGEGGGLAIKVEALERLLGEAQKLVRQGPFLATPRLCQVSGLGAAELALVLTGSGYRVCQGPEGPSFSRAGTRRRAAAGGRGRKRRDPAGGSPFAKLRELGRK
jgi:ATP-dependent RNA helicase SUPV3L1/SUV3